MYDSGLVGWPVRLLLLLTCVSGAISVGIGAYAAHGLEAKLQKQNADAATISKKIGQTETAVRYQMFHTLVLLVIATSGLWNRAVAARIAAILIIVGVSLFSGGIYSIALADTLGHWMIVPAGGATLILGWLVLACSAFP